MMRLLLPFTGGIDSDALDQALIQAQDNRATLVPLSLILLEAKNHWTARPDLVMQSNDFLTLVRQRAARWNILVEVVELYTPDIVQSIQSVVKEMKCAGILLFIRERSGVLLDIAELKQIISRSHCCCYLVALNTRSGFAYSPPNTLSRVAIHLLSFYQAISALLEHLKK